MFSKSYYFVCNACGHRNKWLHNRWSLFNLAFGTWLHCPPLLEGLFIRGEPASYPGCPAFTGLAWLMPCCLIKFALFLMKRRAGPLAKIPVARADISANCGPTRGLAPEDRSRNFMEDWDVNKQATTKISFSFWTLMRLLGDPITSTDILLTHDFVNSARSFDMTNGTICFRKENLYKDNW